MNKISYRRHRFPAEIIQRAVWLCFRFPLSYRDVEDLLAERGVDVSYETIRRWSLKFGQAYARKLRQSRPRPDDRWHLDEVFSSINGKRMYLMAGGGQRGWRGMYLTPFMANRVRCRRRRSGCWLNFIGFRAVPG